MKAPPARRVDMLTGKKAPEKYFQALSEADNFVREIDDLRELQCRVQELEAENAELSERLEASREAHEITRGLLAQARRDVARVVVERDNLRAAVSAGAR